MAVRIPRKQGGRRRERPDDEKLAELYAEHSAAEIGQMYGVSARTVANWVADVRRKEQEELAEQAALEAQAVPEVPEPPEGVDDGVGWVRVVKAGIADRLVVILEVAPEDGTPPYYVVAGATPGDPKAKGSAQAVGSLDDAMKKYEQAIRPRGDT